MIDLYTWPTPNGRKISILLEELKVPYNINLVDITKNKQFTKKFSLIAPSNKIPVIYDHEIKKSIFESGAIMLYLSNKYKKFIPKEYYWQIMEWFFFQISQVGPYLGQAHQFLYYNKGKSSFVEQKYMDYVSRIYDTLDKRLAKYKYLGVEYSIADIATWPWIARFEIHGANIKKYKNVLKWYKRISNRSAVIKGYNVDNKSITIPKP